MRRFPRIMEYRSMLYTGKQQEEYLSKSLVITEKLDGLNVLLYDGEVYSRSGDLCNAKYVGLLRKNHAWKTKGDKQHLYWGEDISCEHSCEYYPIPESKTYRVFMVSDINGRVMSWEEMLAHLKRYDFYSVPVFRDKVTYETSSALYKDICTIMLENISRIGGDLEGIVVRTTHGWQFDNTAENMFKVVRRNHVQPDMAHWRENWKFREVEWGA